MVNTILPISRTQKPNSIRTRVAILANLPPDSGNLAIFWKYLAPNFLVWRNVRPVYLHVFVYMFICRLLFLSLLMVWKFMISN